MGILNIQPR